MFGLSIFEIIFLAALALIVIGPKELPEVARTLGRFLNELKRHTSVLTDELKQQARIDRINLNEAPKTPAPPETAPKAEEPVPEQMELSVQPTTASETKSENKPS